MALLFDRTKKLLAPPAEDVGYMLRSYCDLHIITHCLCIVFLTVPFRDFNILQAPAVKSEEVMLCRPRSGTLQPLPGAVPWILTSMSAGLTKSTYSAASTYAAPASVPRQVP